ncbi:peptidylprolyl isomerase [Paenibacillus timonensis]|uniref:Peptidylprolyl isomerase n=2 Tax=Paenibacillus timonensis TaxID=225915 RepID=A0ABW3SI15_9BACL|nr:peptidylprolyl isomerase [Paenibacillus timonensis]MCH1643141.1 peptidylprolyl isomerase [Paenibacillus timonensis]
MFQSKRRSWRMLLIALVAVLAFSVMAGCGKKEASSGGKDTSKVIATYEGGEITENEFDREQRIVLALQPQMEQFMQMEDFRQYLIKQEIAYEYLETKADDKTKEAGKKKAEEQFDQMKTSYGEDSFKQMLDAQKITEADFKNYMVRIYTVMEGERQKISEDDVKKEFEATKQDYTTATVRHILINFTDPDGKERTSEAALKLAKDVKAKLDKGEDFAALAKQYSEDPGSKDNGGLYENVEVSNWVEAFKQAALTQPLNEIGEPVETEYGYHIIRVEARTEKKYEDLSQEQKDMIQTTLASNKLDEFMSGDLEKKIIKKIELPKVETSTGENGTGAGTNAGNGTNAGTDAGTNAGTEGSGNAGNAGTSGNGAANNAGTNGSNTSK